MPCSGSGRHGNAATHHADRILRTPLHFACSRVRDVCILRVATTCGCRSAVILDVFPFNSAASAAGCFVRVMVAVRGSVALGMLRASSPDVTTSSPWSSDASPRPSPGHFPLPRQRLSLVGRFVGSRGARGSVSGALRSSGCLMRIGGNGLFRCRGLHYVPLHLTRHLAPPRTSPEFCLGRLIGILGAAVAPSTSPEGLINPGQAPAPACGAWASALHDDLWDGTCGLDAG